MASHVCQVCRLRVGYSPRTESVTFEKGPRGSTSPSPEKRESGAERVD